MAAVTKTFFSYIFKGKGKRNTVFGEAIQYVTMATVTHGTAGKLLPETQNYSYQ